MTARTLSLWNAIGCLLLVALVVAQWWREHELHGELRGARESLLSARAELAGALKTNAELQKDQELLKESLKSGQDALTASVAEAVASKQQVERLVAEAEVLHRQLADWQDAVAQRDARIRELEARVASIRARLDEAVARLKSTSKPPKDS